MKKNRFQIVNIVISAILVLAVVFFVLYYEGVFNQKPTVEVRPNNCYDQTLYVITDEDYSPYSFYDNGEPSGYDVELIALIANKLEMNLDLRPLPWAEGIAAINNNEADILMTCDYSDSFSGVDTLLKTEPTSYDDFVVYAKKKISNVNDLYTKSIGIMSNGNVTSQVKMLNLEDCCIGYADNTEAMKALERGEVECVIMRNDVALSILKELGYKDIKSCFSIGQSFMCYGIANNNEILKTKINGAIEELKTSGELDKLKDKWLTTFVTYYSFGEVISNNIWIIFVLIALVFLILASLFKNRIDRVKSMEEKNQIVSIVDNLTNDFDCVNYVFLKENKLLDQAVLVRISDNLIRNIPSWNSETNVNRRLELMCDSIVSEEDREKFYQATRREEIIRNISDGSVYFIKFKAIIDNTEQYFQIKISPLFGKKKDLIGYVFGLHNVDSETKHDIEINQQLRESLEQTRKAELKILKDKAILDYFLETYSSAYSVNLIDDTFEILHMSHDFSHVFKMDGSKDDMTKFIDEHVHPDDKSLMLQMTDKIYVVNRLAREAYFTFTIREIFDGVEKSMRGLIVRETDPYHIAVGFMDISEDIQKEKQLQKKLKEASDAKTDFLFNMSHDIRTPMNAIIGFTNLAEKHIDNKEKVADYLSKIEVSGNHLLELINDVLDMSRVEAGKLHSDMKIVNILDEGKKIYTICKETAMQRDIRLSFIDGGIEHLNVLADELHVNQIVMNILGNAIKYTKPGGKVDYTIKEIISTRKNYGCYQIVVEDTGVGMSKEFIDRIYESFSREETATNSGVEGTGLGMSIVKKLVDYMDGNIDIESELGVGTKVTVTLNLLLEESGEKPDNSIQELSKNLSGKKALLAEDNELNREIATELLEDLGVEVEQAKNGKDALEIVTEKGTRYYDFILMDIQMPFMDGHTATKEIRKLPDSEDLIIIALSANAFEEDKKKSLAAGMNDHVAKPIDVNELVKTLNKYVK